MSCFVVSQFFCKDNVVMNGYFFSIFVNSKYKLYKKVAFERLTP